MHAVMRILNPKKQRHKSQQGQQGHDPLMQGTVRFTCTVNRTEAHKRVVIDGNLYLKLTWS